MKNCKARSVASPAQPDQTTTCAPSQTAATASETKAIWRHCALRGNCQPNRQAPSQNASATPPARPKARAARGIWARSDNCPTGLSSAARHIAAPAKTPPPSAANHHAANAVCVAATPIGRPVNKAAAQPCPMAPGQANPKINSSQAAL